MLTVYTKYVSATQITDTSRKSSAQFLTTVWYEKYDSGNVFDWLHRSHRYHLDEGHIPYSIMACGLEHQFKTPHPPQLPSISPT